MKRFLTTTAVTIALAMPAVAQNSLRTEVENMLDSSTYNVSVESLTDEQVRGLYATLSSTDGASQQNAIIESIVNDDQFVMSDTMIPAENLGASNQIRAAVAKMLEEEVIDADVDDLSNAQVAALYLELTSGDSADATRIEAIIKG